MSEMRHTPSSPSYSSVPIASISKSPFVMNLNDVFTTLLPQGHDKALKLAFYNALAFVFLGIVVLVLIAVHFTLEPFLRPLLWALLCGSALHPFKRKLMSIARKWISDIKAEGTPMSIASTLLPISIINYMIDVVTDVMLHYAKLLIFTMIALPLSYLLFHHFIIAHWIWSLLMTAITTIVTALTYLTIISNTFVILTLVLSHIVMVLLWWNHVTKPILVAVSPFIWFLAMIHVMALIGTFGVFITLSISCVILLGIFKKIIKAHESDYHDNDNVDHVDSVTSVSIKLYSFLCLIWQYISYLFPHHHDHNGDASVSPSDEIDSENINESSDITSDISPQSKPYSVSIATSPINTSLELHSHGISRKNSNQRINVTILRSSQRSTKYLYTLLWAIVLAQLWFHPRLLYFAPIFILLSAIKWLSSMIRNSEFFIHKMDQMKQLIIDRRDALIHPYLSNLFQYFQIGDKSLMNAIDFSLNSLTSLSVIFVMLICILFATIFISIQLYGESLHLVNLMSNVVNSTIGNNPEISQLLPEGFHGINGVLDDLVSNGYHYGRGYIKNTIRNALNVDGNVTKTKIVEKQILEVWDRAYHLWLIRNNNDTDTLHPKGPYNWTKLLKALQTLDISLCFNILKENFDTVISVFDSVWILLKGNVTLLFGAITAVFSLLFGGGTVLLNFCLNLIVFTTALFYLLSASGEQYKPIELVNRLFPASEDDPQDPNSPISSNKFGRLVGEAVNGVFEASLKMMAFYGLYTWLIHTLFEVNIVYIPSVIAAIFGAVPFLGAYWSSLPAVLELWLVHGERGKALLMIVVSILPASFVDSAIYSEIKGAAHPYLTGLAIAGGVFYLGFEGALFGPMLLCCLFVAFNMCGTFIDENTKDVIKSESTPSAKLKLRPQLKRVQSTIH